MTSPKSPSALPPKGQGPVSVGPYRLLEPIGSGGMGEVWLAEDPRLSRQVAVKRIRHDRARGAAFRSRFRREAQAVARLSHPGIVQIHDLVEEEDGDSIVFEYVEGPTVAQLLGNGPLGLALACSLGCQVARALAAAHGVGLIHRDLKAENVIVATADDGSAVAKILDFGLVKDVEGADATALTADAAVVGTFRSMAPEQATGGTVDHRADLFSLGVLLYEMVSGRSPFQGATAADTVDRLLRQSPESLARLRPATPAALASLVDHLLRKEPGKRPGTAREVAHALARIADHSASAEAEDEGSRPEHPGETPSLLDAPTQLGRRLPRRGSSLPHSAQQPRKMFSARALLLSCLVLLGIFLAALSFLRMRAPLVPLRVAILPAEVVGTNASDSSDSRLLQVATNVTLALTRTLVGLQGIVAVDPAQVGSMQGSPIDRGRAVVAAEIVTAAISPQGADARLELRRTRVADGSVVWSDSLTLPTQPENVLLVADAAAGRLRQGFAGHALKAGVPELQVRPEDYEAFLEVHRQIESGEVPWERQLERLTAIVTTSPNFFEAHLVAADTARNLFGDSGDPAQLNRARASLEELQRLAPEDFRTRSAEVSLLLAEGRRDSQALAAAEDAVTLLEQDFPGTVEPLEQRSILAEARGNLSAAVDLMGAVVAREGTWRQLYRLAHLEIRGSRSEDARRHLHQLLDLAPKNRWAKAKLAQQELLYGDAQVAEALYGELAAENPHRSDFNNLGLAQLLQDRRPEARESFRRALELDPQHLATRLNLADAEVAVGNRREAVELYQGILDSFAASERRLVGTEAMMQAQCLARLGRFQEAVDLAFRILREDAEDAEIAFAGALVFSLAGETASALASAREALRLGVAPRWFTLEGFDSLRGNPAFRQLLASASAETPSPSENS